MSPNQAFLDKRDFDIRVGGDTFEAHPIGKLVAEVLKAFDFKLSGGRSVELRVAHNKDVLDTLIEQARDGKFKDKHLVLMICNSATNKETFAKFVELSKTALDKGAASVLMPDSVLHPHAMTMIGLTLKQHPELMDAVTPRELLLRCSALALSKLEMVASRPPAEQLKQLRKQFGASEELEALFRKGEHANSINPSLIDRVEEELRKSWIDFHELVLYHVNRSGGRASV